MTNAELAILSLVVEHPCHGYEMERVIEERGMRDWTEIGFSSIYFLLNKLEKTGLIESVMEPSGGRGPARKVYHVTPAGLEKYRSGVLETLSVPRNLFPPLQLGLANVPGLPRAEVTGALSHYRESLIERREAIRQKWESQQPLPYFVEAMFSHSLTMIQAELDWIENFIQLVEEQNDED